MGDRGNNQNKYTKQKTKTTSQSILKSIEHSKALSNVELKYGYFLILF